MNSVFVLTFSALLFVLGYGIYATKIEKFWNIDRNRPTPAVAKFDGIDFVPAKNWIVLFGHHFSSIAGAGPIIGPILACLFWGWLPALLWVVLGSIFLGGIHDFGSLMISIREGGATIGDVAARSISQKAKIILSVFTWLALILVIAVFAYLCADTFVTQPEIVLPSLGLIPLAIVVGLALYRFKLNSKATTTAGLVLMAALIVVGNIFPVRITGNAQAVWLVVLFVYCFFASTLPVNLLLQPRDYLSSFLLCGGIALGVGGILVSHPDMNAPPLMGFDSSLGFLWPMMFITVACGANSGFHSLIASGTTSKQLATEGDAKKIGFGAMLLEGFLAVTVIVILIGGLSFSELNRHIANKTSPVNLYGLSYGNITAPLVGKWGGLFAITLLNAFILTTLDTATRITRYITQELFGIKNRYIATLIVVILGGWLAFGKDSAHRPLWQKIWPAFGASNQLVAALALLVITCWLLGKGKSTRYSLIPALFMLGTSLSALILQAREYIKGGEYLLAGIAAILVCSALYLAREVWLTFQRIRKSAETLR